MFSAFQPLQLKFNLPYGALSSILFLNRLRLVINFRCASISTFPAAMRTTCQLGNDIFGQTFFGYNFFNRYIITFSRRLSTIGLG